jgi:hypothetical protein
LFIYKIYKHLHWGVWVKISPPQREVGKLEKEEEKRGKT